MLTGAHSRGLAARSIGLGTALALVLGLSLTAGALPATAAADAQVSSIARSAVMGVTPIPKISGSLQVGQTLTAVIGTWTPGPVSMTYQWKRAGAAIRGATAKTYSAVAADLGKPLSVSVTGKKAGYTTVTKTSVGSAAVTTTLTKAPVPTITGAVKVGQRLTAAAGTWAPAPVTLSYQWKRAGAAIAGATGSTYVVRPGDADAALTVTVTGRRSFYTPTAKQSAGTVKAAGLRYANCTALVGAYPHGVAKAGIKVNLANGKPRVLNGPPFFSTTVYTLNVHSDRDKDGIACER